MYEGMMYDVRRMYEGIKELRSEFKTQTTNTVPFGGPYQQ